MNRAISIIAYLALIAHASADDLRIARFDAQRVFDQYQHTKDVETAINIRRNSRQSPDPNNLSERYDAARKRIDDARSAMDRTQAGTPERERAELQLQLATLAAQNLELEI